MLVLEKNHPIIFSIGGSLIIPENIDTVFLKNLNEFIRHQITLDKKFFLIAGGGKICRYYQKAAQEVIGNLDPVDVDWLGIHVTRLNGHLLRTIFHDIAHPRIIENFEHKLENWVESVVIGAGWQPGSSTDYDAVLLARDYGADVIINLSNIDCLYDKNPKEFPDAKPIAELSWDECIKIVGDTWSPGLNSPFDPVAARHAKELGLTVVIANGNDFNNLTNIVEGRPFKGSIIRSA